MDTKSVTKHLVKVEMTDRLLKEVLYINHLIVKKDKSAIEECDDCIQDEHLCGGLWDKKSQLYGFTFYPDSNTDVFWRFEVTKKQIAEIAKGKINYMDLWKCNNPACGNYHAHEKDQCSFCNPIDTAYKPQHSAEELQEMREKKEALFKNWKEQNRSQ
jgi:hypothetical protein